MAARFAKSMVLEVMMNIAYCGVCPFTNVTCLVNKVVKLLRYGFTHDAKDFAFAWCFCKSVPAALGYWECEFAEQSPMDNCIHRAWVMLLIKLDSIC